ncbi:hypothetical protein [Thermomonas fusca]|uniref:VCBS repeat-containing protein n=1 Tax=Thermomonas fusca TaxID=215690 RepID=A0A5R9PD99_9GAMM|nr:hypothetical protein [Thermomonas fusca]TLX21489.1 hypothetical protein E5S66_08105 [Thermomonas fusca]
MIVTASNLQLTGSHASLEYQRRHESLDAWRDGPNGRSQIQLESTSESLRLEASATRLTLSQEALRPPMDLPQAPPAVDAPAASSEVDARAEDIGELKVTLLRLLVEQLTGRKVEVVDAGKLGKSDADTQPPAELGEAASRLGTPPAAAGNGRAGWGATYSLEEVRYESEASRFTAQGIVHTADGKEIRLALELDMSREFASHTRVSVRAGDALKDPLVINFNGGAAQLAQTTFKFDLDADGAADATRFVAPGSGFIALDRNGDGRINDGRELFGALSGNGFADLAQHDDDGNGWIDQNDAVFDRLLVWTRDGDGKDSLQGLLQHGVGALYLGNADTPFALKDGANALQGAIRASGLYLREDGGTGTLQQLDLVV